MPSIGGQGAVAPGDAKLIERAIRGGWDIADQVYKLLPAMMFHVVGEKKEGKFVHTTRERIAAARVLVLMNGQKQKDDPAPQTHIHAHEHRIQLSVEERRKTLLARLDSPGDGGRS